MEDLKPDDQKLIITLTDDSVIYLKDRIVDFDINLLKFKVTNKVHFDVKIAHSFDNQNWSNPVNLENLDDISDYNDLIDFGHESDFIPDVFISIWLYKYEIDVPGNSMYIKQNVETTIQRVTIQDITYNDLPAEYEIQTFKSLINKFPKWNIYDNQYITIKNWIDQNVALSKSYGLVCIYFKTEPTKVNHTLSVTDTREVVSVKKIFIQFPDGELPEDRNIYTEWDYALDGDSVSHIVDKNFKNAFGENTIPLAKDYLYLPIINKLFKVSTVQPGKPMLGVSAWWEVYLSKWEDDETVSMSDTINESMFGFNEYEKIETMINEVEVFQKQNTVSNEEILEKTIDEKKEATQNFTNKLDDSTRFISLKETENQRQFYDERLAIVSVNPDSNAFPVTMYDCGTINKRTVGLSYNLVDCVSVNKKSLLFESSISLNFNYILTAKYSGEIFDILDHNNLSFITVESKRDKIQIINHSTQKTELIDYQFKTLEYYQINLNYNKKSGQLAVSIFILKNTQKKLEYQQVYINQPITNNRLNFSNILLFGGSYYIGEVYFFVNDQKILSDYVNPILNMNKFGK